MLDLTALKRRSLGNGDSVRTTAEFRLNAGAVLNRVVAGLTTQMVGSIGRCYAIGAASVNGSVAAFRFHVCDSDQVICNTNSVLRCTTAGISMIKMAKSDGHNFWSQHRKSLKTFCSNIQ